MPTRPDALSFVLANTASIPHFQPGEQPRLELAATWGDLVLDLRHLAPGEAVSITLPEGPRVEVAVFEEGTWMLDPSRLPGFADLGEERCDLHSLRGRVPLQAGDRVVMLHGDFAWVLRPVPAGKRLAPAGVSQSDLRFGAVLGSAAFLGVLTALLVHFTPPAPAALTNEARIVELVTQYAPAPPPSARAADRGAPAAGEAGGAAPREASHRTQAQSSPVQAAGLLGVLGGEVAELLGDGTGSLIAAAQGLHNGPGGRVPGGGGLAGRGLGPGGGAEAGTCEGDCGLPTATRGEGGDVLLPPKAEGRIRTEEVITIGAIDRSEIDRVVKQNLNSIRYCYQRELTRNPNLGGRVVVKFTIAGDGTVSAATTKASTLDNAAVESCINGRFMRMRFPALQGGGIAIVSYPFLFSAE